MKQQSIFPETGTRQRRPRQARRTHQVHPDYYRSFFYFSSANRRDLGLYSYVRDALSTLTSRASSALAACGGGARRSSLHASAASAIGAREEPTRSDQCSGVPQPFRTLLGSLDTPVAPSHRSRRERRAKPPPEASNLDTSRHLAAACPPPPLWLFLGSQTATTNFLSTQCGPGVGW